MQFCCIRVLLTALGLLSPAHSPPFPNPIQGNPLTSEPSPASVTAIARMLQSSTVVGWLLICYT